MPENPDTSFAFLSSSDPRYAEAVAVVKASYATVLGVKSLPYGAECAAVFAEGRIVATMAIIWGTNLDAMEFPTVCDQWEAVQLFLRANDALADNAFVEIGRHAVLEEWRWSNVGDVLIERTFAHLREQGVQFVLAALGLHVAHSLRRLGYQRMSFGGRPDTSVYGLPAAETEAFQKYVNRFKVRCSVIAVHKDRRLE